MSVKNARSCSAGFPRHECAQTSVCVLQASCWTCSEANLWTCRQTSSEARNHLVENYNCSFLWQSTAKQSAKFVEAIILSRLCFCWHSPLSMLIPSTSLLLVSILTVAPVAGEGWLTWLEEPLQKPAKFKTSNLDQVEKMDKVWGPMCCASDMQPKQQS